ncbi:hypothetical protein M9980_03270 [Sphingomonas donggukensis]|uniref:Uncharacterized protein n=1 Tax=Sphingomonas donggukensis TaxID=2949093 RepID=A0ABY4TX74_9SPHN|nr:hypothetical protein [Sphingomonas donggukensis]URW76261.1 hypothetical protein M9980_03270 [Sphingomonas donggukensis]
MMMTDPDRRQSNPDDDRSDIEQAVDARRDALERGEGGNGDGPLEPTGIPDGIGGTAGVTKNQGDDAH